ncbi:MAG: hypothetical protein HC897_04770 [Thermoanaerobaculia bacterium]|nr:hypothetical protein [Thermoanaerobaculia bacterium]
MSMVMLNAERQEALLELANDLGRQLGQARVPRLGQGGEETIGISKSAVSVVSSFLAAERDLDKLHEFLGQLAQLDQRSAQNKNNPKAEHRVLRDELQHFLAGKKGLDAEELLFVLRWAGRLVAFYSPREPKPEHPGAGGGGRPGSGSSKGKVRHESRPQPPENFGNPMAVALQKALKNKKGV